MVVNILLRSRRISGSDSLITGQPPTAVVVNTLLRSRRTSSSDGQHLTAQLAGLVIEILSSSESESVGVGEYHTENVRGGSSAHLLCLLTLLPGDPIQRQGCRAPRGGLDLLFARRGRRGGARGLQAHAVLDFLELHTVTAILD